MKFIGDNIRKFRAERSISREELAKRIRKNGKPVAPRTILNWEAGVNKPDADSLAQMSELFQKDLILFFKPVSYQNALVSKTGRPKAVRASKGQKNAIKGQIFSARSFLETP